jgi:transposase-like protein
MSVVNKPYFHAETAAFEKLEEIVSPNGPVCPHCGGAECIASLEGQTARPGLRKCYQCRKQFTVKVGTVFESSQIPQHKWFQACYLMCASKKGFSAHQLHRALEVTYKTAWFMAHRIRETVRTMGFDEPMGGEGNTVEVDETFIDHDKAIIPKGEKKGRGYAHQFKVLALVDRKTGRARSMVVDNIKAKDLTPILTADIAAESTVCTDEAGQFTHRFPSFAKHGVARHNIGEYGRGDVHTNTIGLFQHLQTRLEGRVPALRQETPASASGGV